MCISGMCCDVVRDVHETYPEDATGNGFGDSVLPLLPATNFKVCTQRVPPSHIEESTQKRKSIQGFHVMPNGMCSNSQPESCPERCA